MWQYTGRETLHDKELRMLCQICRKTRGSHRVPVGVILLPGGTDFTIDITIDISLQV